MSGLSDQVWRPIRDRRLFKPRQRILIAVSGGRDSMVLLHLMDELARRKSWKLTVAHLNHQLRGKSSDADALLVAHTAKALGWPCVIGAANVREIAGREKLSLEMAARKARHEFLAGTAARLRIPTVALAHHADDQVELFFLRLFRGSGSQGLVGMQWRNSSPFNRRIQLVRPFLGQTRAALAKYAAENKVRFREDASNKVLDIQRNRIRHELLPLLRRRYQPALDAVIARVLEITQAEAEVVSEAAQGYLSVLSGSGKRAGVGSMDLGSDPSPRPSRLGKGRGRSVHARFAKAVSRKRRNGRLLPAGAMFGNLPMAVQRRSLQIQLLSLGIAADFDLIEQLRLKEERAVCVSWDKLASKTRPRSGPLLVIRDPKGLLRVERRRLAPFLASSALLNLGRNAGEMSFDGIQISWERRFHVHLGLPKGVTHCEWFDADLVGRKVLLRHWRPGDRFQPIGMLSPIKLQDFFTSQKIPRERRRQLVLALSADNEVFWVEGMRISERFKLSKATNRRLQWRWQRL